MGRTCASFSGHVLDRRWCSHTCAASSLSHKSFDGGRIHRYVPKIPPKHENSTGTVLFRSSNFGLKGVQGVLVELEWPVLRFECSGCFWIPWLSPKTQNDRQRNLQKIEAFHSESQWKRFNWIKILRLRGLCLLGLAHLLENSGTPKPWITSRKKVGTWQSSMTRVRPEWCSWMCLVAWLSSNIHQGSPVLVLPPFPTGAY